MSARGKRSTTQVVAADSSGGDSLDLSYQRWIQKQMEKRSLDYSDIENINVFCCTWNVNSKTLRDPAELLHLLRPPESTTTAAATAGGDVSAAVPVPVPDIYAVALQEMVDLNVMNVVWRNSPSEEMAAHWTRSISTALNMIPTLSTAATTITPSTATASIPTTSAAGGGGAAEKYSLVIERHMVGMLFVLFAKQSLLPHLSDARVSMSYTGSYGTTGNKGGIVVRLLVHDSPLCFVCAHFHANRDNVAARNLDYQSIVDNNDFVKAQLMDKCTLLTNTITTTTTAAYGDAVVGSSNGENVQSSFIPDLYYNSPGNRKSTNMKTASIDVTSGSSNSISSGRRGSSSSGHSGSVLDEPVTLLSHEQVFWLGDLNYRITADVETEEIFQRCIPSTLPINNSSSSSSSKGSDPNSNSSSNNSNGTSGGWQWLRGKDQLNQERVHFERVFHEFEEGLLTFPPTYKYQPGTDRYDNRPDKKLRAPAWCDRILWREKFKRPHVAAAATATTTAAAGEGKGDGAMSASEAVVGSGTTASTAAGTTAAAVGDSFVRQLYYNSCKKLTMSDHRAVYAQFSCDVRRVVHERLRCVYQDLLLTVDKWINASTPKMALEGRIIDLGIVHFENKYRAVMSAKNVGSVMAEWKFVPKNDESLISKPWLRLSPKDGILAPEETAEIEIVVDLTDYSAVSEIIDSTSSIALDDILIFRVNKGSDFFCMINAVVDASSSDQARRISRAIGANNSSSSSNSTVGNGSDNSKSNTSETAAAKTVITAVAKGNLAAAEGATAASQGAAVAAAVAAAATADSDDEFTAETPTAREAEVVRTNSAKQFQLHNKRGSDFQIGAVYPPGEFGDDD